MRQAQKEPASTVCRLLGNDTAMGHPAQQSGPLHAREPTSLSHKPLCPYAPRFADEEEEERGERVREIK